MTLSTRWPWFNWD